MINEFGEVSIGRLNEETRAAEDARDKSVGMLGRAIALLEEVQGFIAGGAAKLEDAKAAIAEANAGFIAAISAAESDLETGGSDCAEAIKAVQARIVILMAKKFVYH